MTRSEIVQRLLDEKQITAAEAVILLQETVIQKPWDNNQIIGPGPFAPPDYPNPWDIICEEDEMVPYGNICSCNPANGGSGICGCIMGNKMVPKKQGTGVITWSTSTTIDNASDEKIETDEL